MIDSRSNLHNLRLKIFTDPNTTIVAYVDDSRAYHKDDVGALYYVIAVVLIYGLSIIMMIASTIRKNRHDNQLRQHLKEMAMLRKNDRRDKIYGRLANVAFNTAEKTSTSTPRDAVGDEDDTRESLLPKNEENDSVFTYSVNNSLTPGPNICLIPPPTTPQVKIQVINENAAL